MSLVRHLGLLKVAEMKLKRNTLNLEHGWKVDALNEVLTTCKTYAVGKKISDLNSLSDNDVLVVIEKVVKSLGKEIDSLVSVGKEVEKQNYQVEYLKEFLPKKLNESETKEFLGNIKELPIKDIMQKAKEHGNIDLSLVSKLLKEMK